MMKSLLFVLLLSSACWAQTNIQGPTVIQGGAPGPAGPAGPTGPQGPTGPPGGSASITPGQLALPQYPSSTASTISPSNFTYDAATGNNLTIGSGGAGKEFNGNSISSGSPAIDARHFTYAGGLVADGTTDNASVIQAAYNAAYSSGANRLLLACGTVGGCYWADPTQFNWGTRSQAITIQIQGVLRVGTTLNFPKGAIPNIECLNGTSTTSFQVQGNPCIILESPISGVPITGTFGAITPTYIGNGSPTPTTPVVCNSTNAGAVYQDQTAVTANLWTCSVTTGSITSGTNSMTVASAGGYVRGDTITVAGAGAAGGTLQTSITAISGTTFTLFDNASTTVSGAAVAISGRYDGVAALPLNGWVAGAVATVTSSSMAGIKAGTVIDKAGSNDTALGIAETTVCDIATVSRVSNSVSATFASSTGSISSGSSTLTVASGLFSNGAMVAIYGGTTQHNILYAPIISGGGTTTLTIAAVAGSTVSGATIQEVCHIGTASGIQVSGVSDSTFNHTGTTWSGTGPWQVTARDYVKNTLVWSQSSASDATSTGGTVTGFNQDTAETILVGDVTATTFTARFYRPHNFAGNQFAAAGVFLNQGGTSMHINDLQIIANGPRLVVYQTYNATFNNVGLQSVGPCSNNLPSWSVDITESAYTTFNYSVANTGCAPWSIHQYQLWFTGYAGSGPTFYANGVLNSPAKLDHGGTKFVVTGGQFCEHCVGGYITNDATNFWSGNPNLLVVEDSIFQDGTAGPGCVFESLYPDFTVTARVRNINGAYTCVKNAYFKGPLESTETVQGAVFNSPTDTASGPWGFVQGVNTDMELRGEESGLGPSAIPVPTANITTSPGSWTVTAPCSLQSSSLFAPDGSSTAGLISGSSGGSFTIGAQTGITPRAGDFILFGGWFYTPTKNARPATGTGAGPIFVDQGGSSHFTIGAIDGVPVGSNQVGITSYDLNLIDDWWSPRSGIAQVITSDGTASQSIRIFLSCGTTITGYWKPWLVYVGHTAVTGTTDGSTAAITSVSSTTGYAPGYEISGPGIPPYSYIVSISGTTVTINQPTTSAATSTLLIIPQQKEVMRWRQQLMHGAVVNNYNGPGIPATSDPIAANGYYMLNPSGGAPNSIIPNTVTGFQGNSSGVDIPLSLAWSTPSVLTGICHDTNGNVTDSGCPSGGNVTSPGSGFTVGDLISANNTGGTVIADSGIPQTKVAFNTVPGWLNWFGDGSESAPTCTSGCTIISGEHWFPSLNVPVGQTATISNNAGVGVVVIRVTGTCTLAGTLTVSATTGATGNTTSTNFGATGGGGGFGAANGVAGLTSAPGGGAAAGGTSGNTGTAGASPNAVWQHAVVGSGLVSQAASATNTVSSIAGIATYGGSPGGAGGSSGGAGGKGGGAVVLVCQTLNFTGTVDATGQAGGAGGASTGGGGGGGGGFVIMRSPNFTNSGTISVSGGSGGAIGTGTSTAGGNGGNGWSKVFTQ